jgi:RNA polymerase sigma factor FliA
MWMKSSGRLLTPLTPSALTHINLRGMPALCRRQKEEVDNATSDNLDEVVERYGAFVHGLARKLHQQLKLRIELRDLIAYGNIGLLEAWGRFDPNSRATFTSFAYHRIRGAMIDGCRTEGWIGRDRSKEAKGARALNNFMASHQDANQDVPAPRTFSDALSRVEQIVSSAVTILLVEDAELDAIQSQSSTDPLAALEQKDTMERLQHAIGQLEGNERDIIIRHHFGEESLTQIGLDMNLSTSWVSRIHSRALEKLRATLQNEEPRPPLDTVRTPV